MDAPLSDIVRRFDANVTSVYELIDFDRFVVDFAIGKFARMRERLAKDEHRFHSLESETEHAIQALTRIQDNDSLRPHYENIRNQGVVLLVSYFGSAVRDVFEYCLNTRLQRLPAAELPDEEFKLSLAELREIDSSALAGLIAAKKDVYANFCMRRIGPSS